MQKLQQNWIIIGDEDVKQLKEGKTDDVLRSQDLDKNIHLYTDIWARGWTGDPIWLNYGVIYDSKFMKKNCPKTWKLLRKRNNKEKIVIAGFSWLKHRSSISPHVDEKGPECKFLHIGLYVPESKKSLLIVDKKFIFKRMEN